MYYRSLVNSMYSVLSLTSEGKACGVFVFPKHANPAADGLSCGLVVAGDDDDTDASMTTLADGIHNLSTGWVQHAHNSNKCGIGLIKLQV